jgi:ABC-type transport system involved in multi-copper enzyme maturation permease subunit
MSTAALDSPVPRAEGAARPGYARLTLVELRKMTDTRAGFWLLAGIAVLMLALVIVTAVAGETQDRTLQTFIAAALFPGALVGAIVAILLVSSEWSQRTGMITFALVPRRSRVLAAKAAAVVVLSIAILALAIAIAGVGTAVAGSGVAGAWSLPAAIIGQEVVLVTTSLLMGLAFGAVLLSSPPAIVLYFALPISFQFLAAIPRLDGPTGWLDGGRSLAPMTEHVMSATEWARVGTTLAVWVALPLAVGLWRVVRSEVR